MVVRVRAASFKRRFVALAADSLILAGVCALLVWAWGLSEGTIYQYVQGVQFARSVAGDGAGVVAGSTASEPRPRPAEPSESNLKAPVVGPLRPMAPSLASLFGQDPQLIGRLDAPGIDLSVMIREGIDDDTLRKAAGHLPSSALPGEPGNLVLLGHRDTFFRPLRGIQRGDSLTIRTKTGQFTYVVDSLEVTGPDSIKIEQSAEPVATLITCFPFKYIGSAPRRFVVHARLAAKSVAAR